MCLPFPNKIMQFHKNLTFHTEIFYLNEMKKKGLKSWKVKPILHDTRKKINVQGFFTIRLLHSFNIVMNKNYDRHDRVQSPKLERSSGI